MYDTTSHLPPEEGKFSCDRCSKVFRRSDLLEIHQQTHLQKANKQCSTCGKSFKTSKGLLAHESQHTGVYKFSCDYCDKKFPIKGQLTNHLRQHFEDRRYQCSECPKAFYTKNALDDHMNTHTGKKPYVCSFSCDLCPKVFRGAHLLEFHRKRHMQTARFHCKSCGKNFKSSKGFKKHEMSHAGIFPYKCQACEKAFCLIGELNFHKRIHSKDKRYSCTRCPKAFYTKSSLPDMAPTSVEISVTMTMAGEDPINSLGPSRTQLDPCHTDPDFQKEEPSVSSMMEVCNVDSSVQNVEVVASKRGRPKGEQPNLSCSTCGRIYFNKRNLEEHEAEHEGRQLNCVECGKTYAHQRQLKRHVFRVHEARAEPCVVCGVRVKSKYAMAIHLEAHQKGKPFPCAQCGKEFSHEKRLKLHIKNVHQAAPTICDICGKVLKHSSLMKAHMRKHEPEGTLSKFIFSFDFMPTHCVSANNVIIFFPGDYKCDLCPKAFRRNHLLEFHRKRHFLIAKYQCSQCGKRFKTSEGFKKHEMSHTGNLPFKCKDCNKAFAFVGELNFHSRVHSNDRRYSCPACPKAFFLKKVLKDHMNTHTGERPYICEVCGDAFSYGAALRNHKRLKHRTSVAEELYNAVLGVFFEVMNNVAQAVPPSKESEDVVGMQVKMEPSVTLEEGVSSGSLLPGIDQLIDQHRGHPAADLNMESSVPPSASPAFPIKKRRKQRRRSLLANVPDVLLNESVSDAGGILEELADAVGEEGEPAEEQGMVMSEELNVTLEEGLEHSSALAMDRRKSSTDGRGVKGRSKLCQLCGKYCGSPGYLKIHMANQHGVGSGTFPCPDCGKVFPTKTACDMHFSRHSQPASVCEFCGREFKSQQHLRQHAEIHKKIEYKCAFCPKKFMSTGYLKVHEARHKQQALGKFICHICGKVMKAKDTLRGHIRNLHKEKPFSCEICGKKFLRSKALDDHQMIHKGERIYQCDQCDKAYFKKEILDRHILVHSGKRPFSCSECGDRFVYTGSLANHAKIKHNLKLSDVFRQDKDETPIATPACGECGKEFVGLRQLRIHLLKRHPDVGNGRRSRLCDFCGKKYTSGVSFRSHLAKVHGVGEQGDYVCSICGKSFVFKIAFNRHVREHEQEFVCEVCGKHYKSKTGLNACRELHIGSEYPCNLCPRVFHSQIYFKRKLSESKAYHPSSIMGKIMKPGKVVLVLGGRFAGRKAIIVKTSDDGSSDRPYGHALVAGIAKYPKKVTKRMSKKRVGQRSKVKPFVKVLNYSHLMPTRYAVEIPFDKNLVNKEVLKDPTKKNKAIWAVKQKMEETYKSGKQPWFFQKLRF
ncbi:unnamed protein product [Cyprideis torosa]|uniref:Large ribosomal subunit protein eL27 n=1 Tax=Cyprideis torosa TaxID=163714 RepID=A0A7R8W6Z3_9CRUS|nr:unnamed protein product [Cyprideis torosa]CAG0887058.1 unnamed protein product [Cyprideis torosa]